LSSILFKFYSKYLTKEAVEGVGDFQMRGPVIRTVKYSGDHVLLAKGETVLQGMIDRGTEVGRSCVMEINVQKNYSNENLEAAVPITECDRYRT
jgi:predicted phosphoribosyltransferase